MVRVHLVASEKLTLDGEAVEPGAVVAQLEVGSQEAAEQLQVLLRQARVVLDPQPEEG